jgi:hypothetical protein
VNLALAVFERGAVFGCFLLRFCLSLNFRSPWYFTQQFPAGFELLADDTQAAGDTGTAKKPIRPPEPTMAPAPSSCCNPRLR